MADSHLSVSEVQINPLRRAFNSILSAALLIAIGFVAGAMVGPVVGLPISLGAEPATVMPTFRVFWESWNLVQHHYVERDAINAEKMTHGAVDGMLASLGDVGHTRFLSKQELADEKQTISGQLEGIGAQMVVRDQGPTVLAPLPDSPAQRAGILPGDTIVRVDGKDVAGLSLQDVVTMIRGPAGSSVNLTVLHQGETALTDITISREHVTVPSVTWTSIPGTSIAHVLVSQFSEHTGDQLATALKAAEDGGATGVLFDLRNNTGGLRNEAVAVASQFVGDGSVLVEQDANGQKTPVEAIPGGAGLTIPIMTLVNEGTASSAEIVAGALQDHQRGKIVGATTVGTGTVLSTYELSDGSALLLGTKEWFTPNGNQIWHKGITPDVPVALPTGSIPLTPQQEQSLTADELKASGDAQLLAALDLLTTGSVGTSD